MSRLLNRRGLGLAVALVVLGLFFSFINQRMTLWVDSDSFQRMLDKETSKGLKLEGRYGPIHRVGLFGIHTDSFTGSNGYKTIVSLQANEISGSFNPLGVYLRRWEVDNLHIRSGTVTLQKTEPTPGGSKAPGIPWWGLFWPYRVQLQDVKVDEANVLWRLKGVESGIYRTFLEITPNGRDFEYDALGGEFKSPMTPDLHVQHAHLLIRKPRLYCEELVLGDDAAHPAQQLKLQGEAGLQEDHSIKLGIDLTSLDVSPWLPAKLRAHVAGHASGRFDYHSTGTGLETGQGQGHIVVAGCVLKNLAPVRQYVTVTGSPDPGDLALKVCEADLRWEGGAITAENLKAECDGVFRMYGTVKIAQNGAVSGDLEFGLTDPYLKWLPTAKQTIFTRSEGGYNFTTIHLSGTSKKPQQDLSARVTKEVEKSPMLALKLFFNAAGNWFDLD